MTITGLAVLRKRNCWQIFQLKCGSEALHCPSPQGHLELPKQRRSLDSFAASSPVILGLNQRPFAHFPLLPLPLLFTTLKQSHNHRNDFDLTGYICHGSLDFRPEVHREVSTRGFWPRLSSR